MWALTQSDILLDMTSNNWYWRVHPKGFHQTPFEVFHLKGILEGGRAVGVPEDLVKLFNNFVLDVLVDAHHRQEETASSSSGVVTLKLNIIVH